MIQALPSCRHRARRAYEGGLGEQRFRQITLIKSWKLFVAAWPVLRQADALGEEQRNHTEAGTD